MSSGVDEIGCGWKRNIKMGKGSERCQRRETENIVGLLDTFIKT